MHKFLVLLTLTLSSHSATLADELKCAKPIAFVDRWADTNGNSLYDENEPYDPMLTGYQAPADVGLQLTLRLASPLQAPAIGICYAVDLPPLGHETRPFTGGDWFRAWLSECAPYGVSSGDLLQLEPGNMAGPFRQGLEEKIAEDPTAYWDEATQSVQGSAYETSPRLLALPSFDPTCPPSSGQNWVQIRKIAVVFLESISESGRTNVRFVTSALETVPTEGTTWGRIKSRFGEQR